MTPTKVLIGQMLVVFGITLAGTWAATQWVAYHLGFQQRLGETPSYRIALQRTIELWNQARTEHPDGSVFLIARTNKQVADISRAVRAEFKREGVIQGGEAGIEAVTPSGQAARLEIARGDRIRFQLRNDRLGVVNGTLATVIAVHTDPSQEPNTPGNSRELDYGR